MNNSGATLRISLTKFQAGLAGTSRNIAKTAKAFFKASFAKQGKQDGVLIPWKPRSFEWPGNRKAILMGRGSLVRSIRHQSSKRMARVYSNKPYAEIHNEGGTILITPRMRRFFWAMYHKEMERIGLTKSGAARKDKRNASISEKAMIWKSLALTSKKSFVIPKRPFIYHSKDLNDKIDRLIDHLVKRAII